MKHLLLLSAAVAAAMPQGHLRRQEGGIQWGECPHDTLDQPVECATLHVPLDYTDEESEETVELALIKYKAPKGPSKGTIMLNFGGPGQDGLYSMLDYGQIQAPITGGEFDLVSWDPRGTGQTLRFQCFETEELGGQYLQDNPYQSSFHPGKLWAEATIMANACGERLKDTGDLVGMAFAARDMMQIVDALGEDGMLRYWGISGGTTLGATAAALFPERIDKMVLDGVMNSHEYYHLAGEPSILAAIDAAFENFVADCFKHPEKCPFSATCSSPEATLAAIADLMEKLKLEPIPAFPPNEEPVIIDYTTLNGVIVTSLYRPQRFQALALGLARLLQGDGTGFLAAFQSSNATEIPQQAQAVMGIRCGDKEPRVGSLEGLEGIRTAYEETSRWFPGFAMGQYVYACAQWPFEAKERYTGDFKVETKNPLLFIGNIWDPVTPLVSAKNMSTGFDGSVVLEQHSYGHTSLAAPSNCTEEAIAKYFADGTLPEEGTVCEPNLAAFEDAEDLQAGDGSDDEGDGKPPAGGDDETGAVEDADEANDDEEDSGETEEEQT